MQDQPCFALASLGFVNFRSSSNSHWKNSVEQEITSLADVRYLQVNLAYAESLRHKTVQLMLVRHAGFCLAISVIAQAIYFDMKYFVTTLVAGFCFFLGGGPYRFRHFYRCKEGQCQGKHHQH